MKTKVNRATVYNRVLEDFGGLDCAHPPSGVSPNRFTRMENLWRDYAGGEGSLIETFPGFRCLKTLPGAIRGIWRGILGEGTYLFVHAGRALYVWDFTQTDALSLPAPSIVSGSEGRLSDASSAAFVFGDRFYLLDGAGYYMVTRGDAGFTMTEVCNTYIPVTYADGEVYEQRNLLSDYAIARYHIASPGAFSYGTPELKYRILSQAEGTCEVSGVEDSFSEERVYIPATVTLGGRNYVVVAVGKKAFYFKTSIAYAYLSEGIQRLEISAFYGCTQLIEAVLPDSLTHISRAAFYRCPLKKVVLGSGLTQVDAMAFSTAQFQEVVCHGEGSGYWDTVTVGEDNTPLSDAVKTYVDDYPVQFCGFTLYDPVEKIVSLKLDGTEIMNETDRYFTVSQENLVTGLVLRNEGEKDLTGCLLEIGEFLTPSRFSSTASYPDFAAANPEYGGSSITALAQCTLACVYDGRVFFSGNPNLPNTVFYAGRDLTGAINPAYVGVLNYWNAGVGHNPVVALLPTVSYLAVCKGGDHTEGAVLLYAGQDTGENLLPRIYTCAQTLSGETCLGGAANLGSDPVYLSRGGVESIGYESLNTDRVTAHRSTLIDAALAAHRGEMPLSCVWEGYYVLLFPDGEGYLADGRRRTRTLTDTEYEWYHLTGVGGYTGDLPVLRYATGYPGEGVPVLSWGGETYEARLHPLAGTMPLGGTEETYATVYPQFLSCTDETGATYDFTAETEAGETQLYLLTKTGERIGGEFSRPTSLASLEDKLFFGCENGQLFVVNTDQRGADGQIPRGLYSFGGHAITCGFETGLDLCDIPNYTKRTLRNTVIAELRTDGEVSLDLRISHGSYMTTGTGTVTTGAGVAFQALDFRTVSFGAGGVATVALKERNRGWVGKQYRMYTRAFGKSFGLHRLAYSWQVFGRVKNK